MHKILCVEDAPDTLLILKTTLAGYDVATARSLQEAKALLHKERFSLVLLDVELPDGTAFEVMSEFASTLKNIPVIFLTGKTDFATKVSAFSMGADDYIVKPFDPKELRLRVDSKLRKVIAQNDDILQIGPLTCNVQEQRLYKQESREAIDLTSLEFRIFHLLAKTPNKIFSRSEVIDRVWGQSISVSERSVDVHVSNLRKKLEGTGVTIEAVIGSGYRVLARS